MATELRLPSQNQLQKQLQKLAQLQQHQQQLSMWNYTNHRPTNDNDDSWEVRAFAEDTNNSMGTTWPPRSYPCSFCQREFRSAQALGGHMNVHRRERARLQQSQQGANPSPSSIVSSPSSPMVFSPPEFIASGGLCLFYPIAHPESVATPTSTDLTSTLLTMSPYHSVNFQATSLHVSAPLLDRVGTMRDVNAKDNGYCIRDDGMVDQEMDLELRLGW